MKWVDGGGGHLWLCSLSYREVAVSPILGRWKGVSPAAFPSSLAISSFSWGRLVHAGVLAIGHKLARVPGIGLGSTGRPLSWRTEILPFALTVGRCTEPSCSLRAVQSVKGRLW